MNITTFIIPTIDRPTLIRAVESTDPHPYLVGHDDNRDGESYQRNLLVNQAGTEWVSFLDDDDSIFPEYVERLEEEIAAHPEADLIHFRQYFLRGHLLPNWPTVEFGNVGISFSVKRGVAIDNPFLNEEHEDLHFVERLRDKGYNIYFSPYVTYKVRH